MTTEFDCRCVCGHPKATHVQIHDRPAGVVLCYESEEDGYGYARVCDCAEYRAGGSG